MAIYTSDNNNPFNDTTTGLTALNATSTLSIASWLNAYKSSGTSSYDVLYHRQNGTSADGYALFYDDANGFNLRVLTAAVVTNHSFGQIRGKLPVAGQWFHLAATLDGTSARLYLNGLGAARMAQGANATIAGVRRTIVSGVNVVGVGGVRMAAYDMRVWNNHALSPAEVLYVAQGGVLGDESAQWFVGNSGGHDLSKSASHFTKFSTANVYPDPDYKSLILPPSRATYRVAAAEGGGDGTFNRGIWLGFNLGVS